MQANIGGCLVDLCSEGMDQHLAVDWSHRAMHRRRRQRNLGGTRGDHIEFATGGEQHGEGVGSAGLGHRNHVVDQVRLVLFVLDESDDAVAVGACEDHETSIGPMSQPAIACGACVSGIEICFHETPRCGRALRDVTTVVRTNNNVCYVVCGSWSVRLVTTSLESGGTWWRSMNPASSSSGTHCESVTSPSLNTNGPSWRHT